jgi:hypothetical protein
MKLLAPAVALGLMLGASRAAAAQADSTLPDHGRVRFFSSYGTPRWVMGKLVWTSLQATAPCPAIAPDDSREPTYLIVSIDSLEIAADTAEPVRWEAIPLAPVQAKYGPACTAQ